MFKSEYERMYCLDCIVYLRGNLEFTYEISEWKKLTKDFYAEGQLNLWKPEIQPALACPWVLDAIVSDYITSGSAESVVSVLEKILQKASRENGDFMQYLLFKSANHPMSS